MEVSTYRSDYAARQFFAANGWLRPYEVAQRFGFRSDAPVRRAIAEGDLAAHEVFGRIVIHESDLERYVASKRVRPHLIQNQTTVGEGICPTNSRRAGRRHSSVLYLE